MNEISLLSAAPANSDPHLVAQLTDAIQSLGVAEWIALGSMATALVTAWAAIRSNRRDGHAYSLSVAEHRRSDPAVSVELANSQVHHLVAEQRRVYVFHLLVTNQSLAANSIKRIHLLLEFGHSDQPASNVTVPHDQTAATDVDLKTTEVFSVPTSIAPGDSIPGVAVFSVSNSLLDDQFVESYVVAVVDAHNHETRCQPMLLWETES